MYQKLSDYEAIERVWKRSAKKNSLTVLAKYAKGLKSTGTTCFFLSCLCCCCCCNGAYINMADLGANWQKALEEYQSLDPKKVDDLFEKAMNLLKNVRQRYVDVAAAKQEEVQTKFASGSLADYNKAKHDQLMMDLQVNDDAWFHELMMHIYLSLEGDMSGGNVKYITLSLDELQTLQNALPLFYPATQRDLHFIVKMNEKVLRILKARLS